MLRLKASSWLLRPKTLIRLRAMSSNADLLINDSKYSWLKDLGLKADNPGVFDGTWHANGPVRKLVVYLDISSSTSVSDRSGFSNQS